MKKNYQAYLDVLSQHGITKLYHFTDRENLESIIANGGLYSWRDAEDKGIVIKRPGGSMTSKSLDSRYHLERYVRTSFTRNHPMMYVAMNDGRIDNPVVLEIDVRVAAKAETQYADRNAAKNDVVFGKDLMHLKNIHFDTVKQKNHFDLDDDERSFYQAEVMVKEFIPLDMILNIKDFGLPVPSAPAQLTHREASTAQLTRSTPEAMTFMVDQSASMSNRTMYNGEEMSKAEAVAQIVNRQLEEIILRCMKNGDIRSYFDLAFVGYGDHV